MSSNKDLFMDERENQNGDYLEDPTQYLTPSILEISPGRIFTLSKSNAAEFHKDMRTMILESGHGMFEYLELIKFFEKIKEEIFGSQTKDGDKDFKDYVRQSIQTYGKEYKTARGAKFELAETGTKYDFSLDPIWSSIVEKIKPLEEQRKERESFLKVLTKAIIQTDPETGETFEVYPPIKTSTSSFKITLQK